MKTKTIKKILRAKMDEWVASVTDPAVKKAIEDSAFVTGGSIASLLLREKVNDFDVYFRTKSDLKKVMEYYGKIAFDARWAKPGSENVKFAMLDGADWTHADPERISGFASAVRSLTEDRLKFYIYDGVWSGKEKPEEDDEDQDGEGKYEPVHITPNAITLSDRLQIVIRFHGDPEEIHKNYDFVHATNWYSYHSNELNLRAAAMESLLTRELKYIGSLYPLTSILRMKKFVTRGWTISAGSALKIMLQISKLDLTDIDVLEEQLAGVDVAYFAKLIEALRSKKEAEPEWMPTEGYMFEIIDRIFSSGFEDE